MRWLRRVLLWAVAGFALVTALPVACLRVVPPVTSSFMLQQRIDGLARREWVEIRQSWVPWRKIAPEMALAVIASEDQKFARHHGFDTDAIADAVEKGGRGGRLRGASTLTQQLAKNLFLWPGRSWLRKGLEAWFTVLLEAMLPKQRILELYLNVAQFGDGIYGVDAAARNYFGKPPGQLTAEEAALLAAVLPSPNRLSPTAPSAGVRERARWITGQMQRLGGSAYLGQL